MADPFIGKKIGQFELRAFLGQGGMAVVYRAYQPTMDRDVAVKLVSKLLTQDPFFRERFEREVSLAARLEHPNIVPVFEHGTTDDGTTYLAMRYVKGGSLAERLSQGPISLIQVRDWLHQITDALGYAHSQGIIHRDIKPGNILMDGQSKVYLVDFGLARMIDLSGEGRPKSDSMTKSSSFIGTPSYMSPEQIEQKPLDARSDLYSLGVVLYEMTMGHLPFASDSAFRVMQMHINEPPIAPRKLMPDLAPEIEGVLLKALEKKPADRFQTATDMSNAFTAAVDAHVTGRHNTVRLPSSTLNGRIGLSPSRTGVMLLSLLVIVLLISSAVLIVGHLPIGAPPAATSTATALPRPAQGLPDDLILTPAEIKRANEIFKGSFIGMVACNLSSDYHTSFAAAVKTRAYQLGIDVQVVNADSDKSKEPTMVNNYVIQGAKGIVLCPLDQASVSAAVDAANRDGVIVAENADIVPPGGVSLTITNEQLGTAAGKYAAQVINTELKGAANVAFLDYPDLPDIVKRTNAMKAALLADAPNVKIIGYWKGGTADDGQKSMTQAFIDHPEINFILSINDAGTYGAVNVLQTLNKGPNDVLIVSIDAETQARNLIAQGQYLRGSVETSPTVTGQLAVQAIVKIAAGSIVPYQIILPLRMVTKDNVNDQEAVTN